MSVHAYNARPLAPSTDLPAWARTLIEEQRREIAQLSTRLRVYEQFDHVPKEVLSHSQKATVRSAIRLIQEGSPRPDGLIEIRTSDLGADTDQERKTIGAHLRRAHAVGILRYHTEPERDPRTGKVLSTHVFLGATLLTFEPHAWRAPGELARKVGAESHCPKCKERGYVHSHIRNRVIRECMECGYIISDTGDGHGTALLEPPDDESYPVDWPGEQDEPESNIWTAVNEPEGANRPVSPPPPPEGEFRSAASPAFQAMRRGIREDLARWHDGNL